MDLQRDNQESQEKQIAESNDVERELTAAQLELLEQNRVAKPVSISTNRFTETLKSLRSTEGSKGCTFGPIGSSKG